MKRSVLFLLVLVLLALPLTVALGQGGGSDTLVVRLSSDTKTLNPLIDGQNSTIFAVSFLYPALYYQDPQTGLPVPHLATWDISEDGLTYTFHIRDDANWSDGVPITSQDVKFTVDAIGSDKVQSPYTSSLALIDSLNIIDDKNFEIVLKEVNCAIFDELAWRIVPAHKYAADFSDFMSSAFNSAPDISGGPYILDEWSPDEFIRYHANPTYWKGEPKIKNLIVRVITDQQVAHEALMLGDVDYDWIILPENEDALRGNPNLTVYSFPVNGYSTLIMNLADPTNPLPAYDKDGNLVDQGQHPIFGDVRVRKALALGYDKDAIVGTQGEGARRLVGTIAPVIPWAYNDELDPIPYDPDAAAALLDEAGWIMNEDTGIREKDGMPLEFELGYISTSPVFQTIALVAQDQLGQLGMKVNVSAQEAGALITQMVAQTFDAIVMGWTSETGSVWAADPDFLSGVLLHSQNDIPDAAYNTGSYVNPRVDELLDQAKTMPGCAIEDRAPLYKEYQRIVQDDVPIDFVLTGIRRVVYNNRIQNIDFGPWSQFHNIEEWELSQ